MLLLQINKWDGVVKRLKHSPLLIQKVGFKISDMDWQRLDQTS